jgi:tight adherence protein B
MVILKILAVLCAGGTVAVFMPHVAKRLITWWNARIHSYATWMSYEFDAMLETLPVERAKRYITIGIGLSFVFGWLLGGWLAAMVFAVTGYFSGWGVVAWKRRRRLRAIDDQLVDTLVMMANALKAGLSLRQAIELVSQEGKPPIANEYTRIVKEMHLGRLTDDALRRFSERVPLEDVQLFVDSVLMLRETGGNMSETFQVIAATVVDRKKVQGKIQAMTAQGMTQGIVICLFPIGMMLMFSTIEPDYMKPFFTTPLGWLMMTLVFVLDGMGLALMYKLVQVEV